MKLTVEEILKYFESRRAAIIQDIEWGVFEGTELTDRLAELRVLREYRNFLEGNK